MEIFYFFLLLIVIAGAFYVFLCVKDVREQALHLYCEMMKSLNLEEPQDDEDTLS